MGKLDGKVAFITGAARGQGRSHAVRLAEEGADIVGVDVCGPIETVEYQGSSDVDLKETQRLVEERGRKMVGVQGDVRDFASVESAVQRGIDTFGHVDVVAANAGILSIGQAHDLTEAQWMQMIDINLNGVWRTCKAVIPHMISAGRGGSIVITSSGASLHGVRNISHYVAAKTGVVGLMRSLSVELAEHQIRVNALNPTNVNSKMIQNEMLYRLYLPHLDAPTQDDFSVAVAATHPMGVPWVEPIDVSNALVFLASDESRYITGIQLPIMAGRDC
jgi:SDR family mycofactocin-dependent oxidoreductase